jgi:hypothetical protein
LDCLRRYFHGERPSGDLHDGEANPVHRDAVPYFGRLQAAAGGDEKGKPASLSLYRLNFANILDQAGKQLFSCEKNISTPPKEILYVLLKTAGDC